MTKIMTRRWATRPLARRLRARSGPVDQRLRERLLEHLPGSSTGDLSSEEIYNEYDKDNNNNISQGEWDQAYTNMDSNGDGTVTRDEYNAAVGAGGGRR